MDVRSQLKNAQLEHRGTNPTKKGEVVVQTADGNQVKYNDGTDVRTVVNTDQAQTLTNKTIVAANNTITTAASGNLSATNLNAALAELQTDIDTRALDADLDSHLSDATDAHDASAISFDPQGTIAATTVQLAIEEVATEAASDLSSHLNDTTDAHDASAISYTAGGTIVATDVQAAIAEAASDATQKATLTTKGDLYVATGAGAVTRLGVGTNTYVLTADSAESPGMKWALPPSAGSTTVTSVSSDYTALTTDHIILVDSSLGIWTVTLPALSGNTGKTYIIKNFTGNTNAIVDGNGSETIDGITQKTLSPGESIELVAGSTGWSVTAFTPRYVESGTSSVKTPSGSAHFLSMSLNAIGFAQGVYEISAGALFSNNGSSPSYGRVGVGIYSANGADNGTPPAALSSAANITVLSTYPSFGQFLAAGSSDQIHLMTGPVIVRAGLSAGSIRVVPYAEMTTPSNARITTYLNVRKVGH